MLKALVAVACVAVIAIAGLLFWQERQRAEARAIHAEMRACSSALDEVKPVKYETPESYALQKRVVDCRLRGMISDRDWEAKIVNRR